MKPPIEKTGCHSLDFKDYNSVCFNAVRAVFLELFGYRQTDRQTDRQKVSFCNTDA